jgi:hypothetical protein
MDGQGPLHDCIMKRHPVCEPFDELKLILLESIFDKPMVLPLFHRRQRGNQGG